MLRHNYLRKRKGILIKNYKLFHVFLLENGLIIFYTVTAKSKKYGKESRRHRIQLDESLRIEDIQKVGKKGQEPTQVRFTIRIGKTRTRLESKISHQWVEALQEFNFSY